MKYNDIPVSIIQDKVKDILKSDNVSISRLENVPNNSVYIVESDKGSYVFKIYAQRDWPEDGKLMYVQSELEKAGVSSARILMFDRCDSRFPNGCLLEEKLSGVTADRLPLTDNETEYIFCRLADLSSNIHNIPVRGYGYIGAGVGCYDHLSDFLIDVFNENLDKSAKMKLIDDHLCEMARKMFVKKALLCGDIPSVLCHGDLSLKNVIVHGRDITLIDWDDATAYSFMGDVVRLCLWMRLYYGEDGYLKWQRVFLKRYFNQNPQKEDIYHRYKDLFEAFFALDFMAYYKEGKLYQKTKEILIDSL